MNNVENKTSQDAEGRVLDAVRGAAKTGKWLAMVFSIEDGFPRNTSKLETTTYNMPTAAFVECLAKASAAMLEEMERLAQKDAFDTPLPMAPGFDRPTVPLHPEKKSEEEMVAEEEVEIAKQNTEEKEELSQLGEEAEAERRRRDIEIDERLREKQTAKLKEQGNPCQGDIPCG